MKQPPAAVAPAAAPTAAAAADEPAATVVELKRPRFGRVRPPSWLWVALPITGLLLVPLIGLLYAATTSFGKGDEENADAATSADLEEGDEPATGAAARRKKATAKKARSTKSTSRARTDSAAICCAKLHELGKTEPVEDRSRYLSAAAACEAASDAETAFKRVASSLRIAKLSPPPECDHEGE
ncbi:MAG: hypothetical protein HOW73_03305 [Polyangiaceae bacterium]|nr:hypothetical protein [Polyangiaceae bacterium]